jgi:hypothetical protein
MHIGLMALASDQEVRQWLLSPAILFNIRLGSSMHCL